MENNIQKEDIVSSAEPKEKAQAYFNKKQGTLLAITVLIFVLIFSVSFFVVYKSIILPKMALEKKMADTSKEQANIGSDNEDDAKKGDGSLSFDAIPIEKPLFARYEESASDVAPNSKSQKIQVDKMVNWEAFTKEVWKFSNAQKSALEEDGFFLADNEYVKDQTVGNDDFADTYQKFTGEFNKYYRKPQDTLFISSDAALHFFHILVDRSFQKIEEDNFQPMIKEMSRELFLDSIEKYNQAGDPLIKDSYKRLSVFYLIPLVILDSANGSNQKLDPADFETYAKYIAAEEAAREKSDSADLDFSLVDNSFDGVTFDQDIFELAKAELELIKKSSSVAKSPLFTPFRPYFENDYTQFTPRSHYTKNAVLKSYFMAMMWYGRMGFSLDSPELVRDAVLMTDQINRVKTQNFDVAKKWSDLSTAIEFFVGEVDDLTPLQFNAVLNNSNIKTIADLSDESKLASFTGQAVRELPKPRIVSEAVDLYDDGGERDKLLKKLMQFRFFGQRFTPDAYVINNLVQGVGKPDPETGQTLPSMSTALMPIYVLQPQNKLAGAYVGEWVKNEAPTSDKIIAKQLKRLSNEFSALPESTWTQNIYWGWLNSYRPLLQEYGNGYPQFMIGQAWQKKNLGTVLGSYTELKHDTLLYAKQSYAERGAGGGEPPALPPVPKGYVEPDLVFWKRLEALAKMTKEGLEEMEILPQDFSYRYDILLKDLGFFRELTEKELANETISEDDFEKLRTISANFIALTDPLPGQELTNKDRRAGIIADIHTDAVQGEILYEATGKPFLIFVAVSDANGARLTRGLAFRHYEFTAPLAKRLTDEDWQATVYDGKGKLPLEDAWSRDITKE